MKTENGLPELTLAEVRSIQRLHRSIAAYAEQRGIRQISVTHTADDFAQDCLIEFVNARSPQNHSLPSERLAWKIAERRLVDHRRKRNELETREAFEVLLVAIEDEQIWFDESPQEVVTDSQFSKLKGCASTAVDILRLKHIARYSYQEIATAMNMTADGVKSSLRRSHQRYRSEAGVRPCTVPIKQESHQ